MMQLLPFAVFPMVLFEPARMEHWLAKPALIVFEAPLKMALLFGDPPPE